MAKFIGAEYIVASMLIEEKRRGIDFVSFDTLGKSGIYIQKCFIDAQMDVVLLTSRPKFLETIYDFSDYFTCNYDMNGQPDGISIKKSKTIDDLECRFVYYMPFKIAEFLQNAIKSFVDHAASPQNA